MRHRFSRFIGWTTLLIGCLGSLAQGHANPANQAALQKHFGTLLGGGLQSCVLCHVREHAEDGDSLEEFPHNSFGDSLRRVGERLLDEGRDDAIPERLAVIADEDADADGSANLVELLLGTPPGDPSVKPSAEQLARADRVLADYRAVQQAYRWRPFDPVRRPRIPDVGDAWGSNPIDSFLQARRVSNEVTPNPEASAEHLLRRVSLDLIGLNPSVEAVRQFVDDYASDPVAYDRMVDRLLEHPAYGERWARHWMDVWRYSDWAGYKDALRESQRHIWHWRDWIIESLNEDAGYDSMVMQMLAADEMQHDAVGDHAQADVRATGYLARNYFHNRDQWMDNVVKHTSQAFMGITLGCAKCHDHMTDPFEQVEYYRMRAIFEPYAVSTDRVPGQLDVDRDGVPRVFDKTPTAKTYLFQRGDERFPEKDKVIEPGIPGRLGGKFSVSPVKLSYRATHPDQRPFVVEQLLADARGKLQKAEGQTDRAVAEAELLALEAELELERRVAAGMVPESPEWRQLAKHIHALQREALRLGAEASLIDANRQATNAADAVAKADAANDSAAVKKAKQLKAVAEKAVVAAEKQLSAANKACEAELTTKFTRRKQTTYPDTSSGRRLAFARWLVDRHNPLTARVAVNHIWLRHFGRGLVSTPNDFGTAGETPSHPALLDWLAAELMENDWSMKHIHRLIVTSASYRLSSEGHAGGQSTDPDNTYYWRGPQRRMEGEIVRDNLLYLAGRLDRQFGGPDIDHTRAQTSPRRSLYLRHAHEKLVPFVQIFDGPAVSECYQREISVQPHQALALSNSKLSVDAANAIETELATNGAADDDTFIRYVFLKVLCRLPTVGERDACRQFLKQGQRPRFNLVLVLLNHNDFVSIR